MNDFMTKEFNIGATITRSQLENKGFIVANLSDADMQGIAKRVLDGLNWQVDWDDVITTVCEAEDIDQIERGEDEDE